MTNEALNKEESKVFTNLRAWYKGCALAFQANEDRFESGRPLHLI